MKQILLISILILSLITALTYYQLSNGSMLDLMSWLAGDEIVVDLSGPRPPEDANTIERGQVIFEKNCSVCHGDYGEGDSIRSVDMQLKPGALSKGDYKYRSTTVGSLPRDEDIFITISRGIRGTGMLPWFGLSSEDKWAVTYFIKTLSERFGKEVPRPAIVAPDMPVTTELINRGELLFEDAGCRECHGMQGQGDGPMVKELKDNSGLSIKLRGFRAGGFKRGFSLDGIYISIATGIDGTPMSSYDDVMTDEDMLAVAAYVNSIARQHPRKDGSMMEIVPITADEHAGVMMNYSWMPVGLMRYGMLRLYSGSGRIK